MRCREQARTFSLRQWFSAMRGLGIPLGLEKGMGDSTMNMSDPCILVLLRLTVIPMWIILPNETHLQLKAAKTVTYGVFAFGFLAFPHSWPVAQKADIKTSATRGSWTYISRSKARFLHRRQGLAKSRGEWRKKRRYEKHFADPLRYADPYLLTLSLRATGGTWLVGEE